MLKRSLITLILVFGPIAKADTPQEQADPLALKKLSLEELSQLEVTTPSKEPVKAFQTPAAIYVVTSEDLRRSGATSIPSALRLVPGVEVAQIDANNWSIGIRGFGSNLTRSVLVLIDGRTVYTPLFAGTNWDVQNTLMEDIDRIEVIRGPGGTIWGPNAVNGVINIITKDSKDTQGLLVSAGGGNQEQGLLNLRYGGGNGRDFSYRVYGMGFTRGPEDHPTGPNFDDWRDVQGGFRMDWKEARDTFTLQGDLYDEEAGKSVQVNSYTPPFQYNVNSNALLSGGNILGRWRRTFDSGNDFQVQVYYDRADRTTANFEERRDTYDIDYLQRVRLPVRQELSFGLGARVDPIDDTQVVSGLTFLPAKRTDYLATGFVQDEIRLVEDRLSFTVGTKALRTDFTKGISLEPSARLLWTPTEKQTVWAAFTHALRTPSDAEENFYLSGYNPNSAGGTPVFARFNANPEFAPEQMNGYELGARRLLRSNMGIGVASFYNHYHDLFSEDITGAPFVETTPAPTHFLLPAQFRNGLMGITKGVEANAEWRPASFWRLRGSYSYLHMNVYASPGSGDVGTGPGTAGSSPQNQATIHSNFDLTSKLELDLIYRYVGILPGGSGLPVVPGYSTGDARIGWHVSRHVEFSLAGQNLFQPSHPEYAGDPYGLVGIKRSVYGKLTWRM